NAPAVLKDRMPRVVERKNGRIWETAEGVSLGLAGGMGSGGRRYQPGQIHRSDRMAEQGLYADQDRGVMRPAIPELRIKDQDLDGVCGEVLYGILGAANKLGDPEVTKCVVRIYNEWLSNFCKTAPNRFAGVGCIAGGTPEESAAEIRRIASLGLKGAELGLSHDMLPLWHSDWEPVWKAAAETGIPVHLHTIGPKLDERWYSDPKTRRPWFATHMTGFQIVMLSVLAGVIFGGALERHRNLKVVIGEAGIGWIPYVLERMDYEWEDQFKDVVPRKPSEYWYGQMYATFQIDRTGLENIGRVGEDNIMWGNDFPHPDGIWPDSRASLDEQLAGMDERIVRKITHDNAAKLYGFTV
ncbi:MAG: amidohydrolase family protein, partial [Pseudomonadota bacterium]